MELVSELVETFARTIETKLSRGVRLRRRITEYYELRALTRRYNYVFMLMRFCHSIIKDYRAGSY